MKFLITFGTATKYHDKCAILSAESETKVRAIAYSLFGQENISTVRDYNKFEYLIRKYNYEIIADK